MRLHEALTRFNVGLETAAQFLASRRMPLKSKNVNSRIREFQASALSREFGYAYSSTLEKSGMLLHHFKQNEREISDHRSLIIELEEEPWDGRP